MSVVIVATIEPIEGRREDLIAFLEEVIAKAHAEDEGCEFYALHEADDRLVFIEKWANGDALKAHSRGRCSCPWAHRPGVRGPHGPRPERLPALLVHPGHG